MRRTALTSLFALLACTAAPALAADADAKDKATLDRLLHAIQANDREAFLAGASEKMHQALTPQLFAAVRDQIAADLDKGYSAAYLTDLKQKGYVIRLWKLTFKDGRDDALVRIATDGDTVAGVFLQ